MTQTKPPTPLRIGTGLTSDASPLRPTVNSRTGGIGADRRDGSAPPSQRVGAGLDVGEQGRVGDGEMAHLAALVEPRGRRGR